MQRIREAHAGQGSGRCNRRWHQNPCKAATAPPDRALPLSTVCQKVANAGVIVAGRPRPRGRRRRRQRLLTRALPVVVLALVAFAAGIVLAMRPGHEERQMVTRYVTAWDHSNYAAMYALLDTSSRGAMSESRFARALESAGDTATLQSLVARHVAGRQGNG